MKILPTFALAAMLWPNAATSAAPKNVHPNAPATYSLNAVNPGATGPWRFYAAAAGETNTSQYVPVTPSIDATNVVRVMAEVSEPYRPRMDWEYGFAAGLISVHPESDRNVPSKKGDLIVLWQAPARGLYEIRLTAGNVGTDVQGGDGGTITLSLLRTGESDDTNVLARIAVPASDYRSPQVQHAVTIDVAAGDRILMRLNAGIDGFGDQWQMRYVIAQSAAKAGATPTAPR